MKRGIKCPLCSAPTIVAAGGVKKTTDAFALHMKLNHGDVPESRKMATRDEMLKVMPWWKVWEKRKGFVILYKRPSSRSFNCLGPF